MSICSTLPEQISQAPQLSKGYSSPKKCQKLFAPAYIMYGKPDRLVQFLHGDRAFLLVGYLINEIADFGNVSPAEKQDAMGRISVTSCTSCLLVIAFNILGKVGMNNETYIGLVDAHTEGDGRYDHRCLIPVKGLLIFVPLIRRQSRVIGQGPDSFGYQESSGIRNGIAGRAIDDARLSGMLFKKFEYLRIHLLFSFHLIKKVRAVKGCADYLGDLRPILPMISSWTLWVAVAVKAATGTSGNIFGIMERLR